MGKVQMQIKRIPPLKYLCFLAVILTSTPSIASEEFYPPEINGTRIDRCAYLGSSAECSEAATKFAANSFCKYKGYSYAKKWYWTDGTSEDTRYIARSVVGPNANYEFALHTGAYIFNLILCN